MAGRYQHFFPCLCVVSYMVASCAEPTGNRWIYTCDDGYRISATFLSEPEEVILENIDGNVRLKQVPSGSGAKYSDNGFTFWTKGSDAFIEKDEKIIHRECMGKPA